MTQMFQPMGNVNFALSSSLTSKEPQKKVVEHISSSVDAKFHVFKLPRIFLN